MTAWAKIMTVWARIMTTWARMTALAKCDLVALLLIWAGTMWLTFIAVPDIVPDFLTGKDSVLLMGADGAVLKAVSDPWHYRRLAAIGAVAITAGMALQALSIVKRD